MRQGDRRGTPRRFTPRRIASVPSALVLVVMLATPSFAANVILDGAGGGGGRTTNAMGPKTAATVYGGVLNVFAHDAAAGNLRWGVRGTSGWTFSTIDGAGGVAGRVNGNVGEDQAAAVFDGALHVFFYDRTRGDLRHGRFDGASWRFTTIDGAGGAAGRVAGNVGLRVSVARFAGALHVAYANTSTGDVRLASFDGMTWSFRILDGAGGSGGRVDANVGWNTAAAVYGSRLHVFYFHQDPSCEPDCNLFGWIREANWDGTTWRYRIVHNINCCMVDQSLAVAIRGQADVLVFYENFGLSTQNLRALRWNGSAWSSLGCVGQPFEPGDIVGGDASAAVTGGVVRVTYHDAWSTTLGASGVAHTTFDGTTWRTASIGIQEGSPSTSVVAGGLVVLVGDARIGNPGSSEGDLVLASPPATGMVIPPDPSCG